jgi:hypothetical protein
MFEPFVAAEPGACHEVCDQADLIFMNEAEYRALYRGCPHPSAPTLLKRGRVGAQFIEDGAGIAFRLRQSTKWTRLEPVKSWPAPFSRCAPRV